MATTCPSCTCILEASLYYSVKPVITFSTSSWRSGYILANRLYQSNPINPAPKMQHAQPINTIVSSCKLNISIGKRSKPCIKAFAEKLTSKMPIGYTFTFNLLKKWMESGDIWLNTVLLVTFLCGSPFSLISPFFSNKFKRTTSRQSRKTRKLPKYNTTNKTIMSSPRNILKVVLKISFWINTCRTIHKKNAETTSRIPMNPSCT